MRLLNYFILTVLAFFALSSAARADARSDTLQLHKIIVAGMKTYIGLSKEAALTPASAYERLDEKVKRPVSQAQMNWWNAFHGSADNSAFHPFMICNNAAQSMQDVADDMMKALKSGSTETPDAETSEKYLATDITECEVALGIKPTFGN